MSNFKTECRKFQPNIFNKIKCANCFRHREEHSAEALESNRASRKVSKCGYLFVAPDWDFSNPLNRTKRWQRRWFVLFDDGELTYSVDDLPATIPQGVIDMNRVLEVSEAEDVTGNQFALAITSPDRATFVKGTSREESRWWREVLAVFPRMHMQHGRHKRNATFPGIKSSSACVLQQRSVPLARTPSPSLVSSHYESSSVSARFRGAASEPRCVGRPSSAPALGAVLASEHFPMKEAPPCGRIATAPMNDSSASPLYRAPQMASLPPSARLISDEHKENTPPYIQDYADNPPTSESPPTQDKAGVHRARTRRAARRDARAQAQAHARSKSEVSLFPAVPAPSAEPTSPKHVIPLSQKRAARRNTVTIMNTSSEVTSDYPFLVSVGGGHNGVDAAAIRYADFPSVRRFSTSNNARSSDEISNSLIISDLEASKRDEKLKDIADSLTRPRENSSHSYYSKENGVKPTRDTAVDAALPGSMSDKDVTDAPIIEQIRGDPDGCGLSTTHRRVSIAESQRVQLPAEDLLRIKKGWLMKTNLQQDWSKHWFVVEGGCMKFFRDPSAEERGLLDGVIDLGIVKNVYFKDVGRNYGFILTTWDDKPLSFCALTSGMREQWVNAIRNAANLQGGTDTPRGQTPGGEKDNALMLGHRIEQEIGSSFTPLEAERESPSSVTSSSWSCSRNSRELSSSGRQLNNAHVSSGRAPGSQCLSSTRSRSSPPPTRRSLKWGIASSNEERTSRVGGCVLTPERDSHKSSDDILNSQTIDTLPNEGKKQSDIKVETSCKLHISEPHESFDLSKENDQHTGEQKSTYQTVEAINRFARSMEDAESKVNSLTMEPIIVGEVKKVTTPIDLDKQMLIKTENKELKSQMRELKSEMCRLRESFKTEKSEVYKWKDLVKELRSLLEGKNTEIDHQTAELSQTRDKLMKTQTELASTADRLRQGIDENEALCARIRDLQRNQQQSSSIKMRRNSSNLSIGSRDKSSSRRALPRMDSLSDLTNLQLHINPDILDKEELTDQYTELRLRFERAVNEILALKKEIRSAEAQQDETDITNQRLKSDLQTQMQKNHAEMHLMTSRIQDLANKLSNSEKQARTLKQRQSRTDSRDRRRTLSLKGRESLTLSKEMETKLTQLESQLEEALKMRCETVIEVESPNSKKTPQTPTATHERMLLREARRSKSFEDATRRTRQNRRKSLDGHSATEEDPIAAIVRVKALEDAISNLSGKEFKRESNTSLSSCSTSQNTITDQLTVIKAKSPPHISPASSRKTSLTSSTSNVGRSTKTSVDVRLLKEKVALLDKLLSSLSNKLTECDAAACAMECVCSCDSATMARLRDSLSQATQAARIGAPAPAASAQKMLPLALRIGEFLRDKLTQLASRRSQLRSVGKWNRNAQLRGLAEKLGFEAVLTTQAAQVIATARTGGFEESIRLQELSEAHRRITFLEKRLQNPGFRMEPLTPLDFHASLLAEKLLLQGDVLDSMGGAAVGTGTRPTPNPSLDTTCRELLTKVLERERELAGLVSTKKEEHLRDIAIAMAREASTDVCVDEDEMLPEERRLREAWAMAEKLVAQEVASIEASQSVLRMAHVLGNSPGESASSTPRFTSASLEQMQMAAEESLRQEMEESTFTLSAKYEEALSLQRRGEVLPSNVGDIETVLSDFAALMAQKSLIDGQLAVATGEETSLDTPTEPCSVDATEALEMAGDVAASEAHLLMFLSGGDTQVEGIANSALNEAEFAFVYSRATHSANTIAAEQSGASDRDTDGPPSRSSSIHKGRRSGRATPNGMTVVAEAEICRQCEDLRNEIALLRRASKDEDECGRCSQHVQTIKVLEEEHRAETDRLRDQVKYDPPTRDSDDELTELKRRLCLLEEGYEAQIAALKKQYQEALGSQSDVCEETIRLRYQREIEHLRDLCEKGLTAMESSHRRVVSDLEAKHRSEMESLKEEKEEALAEETQATLAALDAMRKAHEAEVQKEVAKFKEELLRANNAGTAAPHEAELREVRREILALSEKYSSKCLETAAKEQKLDSLQRQLTEAKAQARALEERNRLLRQRMDAHISTIKNSSDKSGSDKQHQFECELALKDEEIAWLNQVLQKTKMHESDLGTLCGRLGFYLTTSTAASSPKDHSASPSSPSSTLLATHNTLACHSQAKQGQSGLYENRWCCSQEDGRSRLEKKATRSKEACRSPSCPGLSRFSAYLRESFMSVDVSRGLRDPSPLTGMVAQRKKVFEGPAPEAAKAVC